MNPAQFRYTVARNAVGEIYQRPVLPLRLSFDDQHFTDANALLDSGADMNVIPYTAGLRVQYLLFPIRRIV